jgi:AsmA protein
MGRLGKIVLIFFAVLLIALVSLPLFISSDDIFAQLNSQIEKTTGRTLSIAGDKSMHFLPSLALSLNKVSLSNHVNGSPTPMLSIESIDLHIPWLSLLSGELRIDKFVLNKPNILLEKSADGQANWQLLQTSIQPAMPASAQTSSADDQGPLPSGFDISLGQVEINQGKVSFIDHQSGQSQRVDKLNIALFLPTLNQAMTINGSISYLNKVFNVTSTITTPRAFINSQATKIKLALKSDLFTLAYDGQLLEQGKSLSGDLQLNGASVKNILSWLKQPLVAKDNAFNQFSLSTKVHFKDDKLSLSQLQAKLDQLDIRGQSTITLITPLTIAATIDLGDLDLNPYLPQVAPDAPPATEKTANNSPLVWDQTKIDLSSLKQLNANIELSSNRLIFNAINLGKNHLKLTLAQGNANINLVEFSAYQGNGRGSIRLQTNVRPYRIITDFTFSQIQAGPLLKDVIGFDKLIGTGQLSWKLSTQGYSQADFVQALNGPFSFKFSDGAVKGVNLGALARSAENLLKGNFKAMNLDQSFDQSKKTDFAQMSASLNFVQGVASNNDLSLLNPFIRVSGSGKLDLVQTKLNFKIATKVVASAAGTTSATPASGFVIPIKISGPFHQIKIRPDVSSKAKDTIKQKLTDKLKKLFG